MISFLIPAYNEERLLPGAIAAVTVAAQAVGEPYEIVVANDGSTDRTALVAGEGGAQVVTVAHRQIAATRNAAARASRGEHLIFVDADTLVDEAVVRAALKALRAGAVGGGAAIRFDEPVPRYARILLPPCLFVYRVARLASGCFIFCQRQAFEKIGGFNEEMYGAEEVAISQALKQQGRFVVLREAVTTSGRKLRAYTGWEILAVFGRLSLKGCRSVSDRNGMGIWYDERRADPREGGSAA